MQTTATFQLSPEFDDQLAAHTWAAIDKAAAEWGRRADYPEWMDKRTAGEYLGVSAHTLNGMITAGLTYHQVGGTIRLSKAEINRFMQEHKF